MHVVVGKIKAAWEYANSFHSFSHGYLKKLSKTTEKNPSWVNVTWLGLAVRALRTPPTKPSIFFHHFIHDKKD